MTWNKKTTPAEDESDDRDEVFDTVLRLQAEGKEGSTLGFGIMLKP